MSTEALLGDVEKVAGVKFDIDVDSLEAGPKLDALIAEKVMGGKLGLRGMGVSWDTVGYGWSPSTSIADAWEVVLKLQGFSIGKVGGSGEWCCSCYGGLASADTAPLAICRAALKAVLQKNEPRQPG